MHRQTGAASAFRGYDSGGGRALIDKIDDSPLMQTMTGSGMKGESFSASSGGGKSKGPESPQNYGFTSVVADATKGANGMIQKCAEGFMSFIGGNRSFPVCGVMDDRRHRLKNLGKDAAKGSVAIHGLKEWGQQMLNTDTGMFMTGNKEKKIRLALVENQNGKTQQQQGGRAAAATASARAGLHREPVVLEPIKFMSKSGVEFEIEVLPFVEVEAHAGNGGGSSGGAGGAGGQQAQSKSTGQKTLHKEESTMWIEQNGTNTQSVHGDAFATQQTGSDSSTHWEKDKKKSTQVTKDHTHIRFKDNRIYNDQDGNWCTSPLLVKKDEYCKEG